MVPCLVMAAWADWDPPHILQGPSAFSNPPTISSHLLHSPWPLFSPTTNTIFPKASLILSLPETPTFTVELGSLPAFSITSRATANSLVREPSHTCNTQPLLSTAPARQVHVTEFALGPSEFMLLLNNSPLWPIFCHFIIFSSFVSVLSTCLLTSNIPSVFHLKKPDEFNHVHLWPQN